MKLPEEIQQGRGRHGIWKTRDPRGEEKGIPKIAVLQILASNYS